MLQRSGAIPGGGLQLGNRHTKGWSRSRTDKTGSVVWIDPDFIQTYGITVVVRKSL